MKLSNIKVAAEIADRMHSSKEFLEQRNLNPNIAFRFHDIDNREHKVGINTDAVVMAVVSSIAVDLQVLKSIGVDPDQRTIDAAIRAMGMIKSPSKVYVRMIDLLKAVLMSPALGDKPTDEESDGFDV